MTEATRIGKRGTVVIPAALRRKPGFADGAAMIKEETAEGVLFRPAVPIPLEVCSSRRKAEFLLANAVGARGYARAVMEVCQMDIDPAEIPHRRPPARKK